MYLLILGVLELFFEFLDLLSALVIFLFVVVDEFIEFLILIGY